jgi:hypothetical protein
MLYLDLTLHWLARWLFGLKMDYCLLNLDFSMDYKHELWELIEFIDTM